MSFLIGHFAPVFSQLMCPFNSLIESLNSVIRAAIKKRKVFPTDDSAYDIFTID